MIKTIVKPLYDFFKKHKKQIHENENTSLFLQQLCIGPYECANLRVCNLCTKNSGIAFYFPYF